MCPKFLRWSNVLKTFLRYAFPHDTTRSEREKGAERSTATHGASNLMIAIDGADGNAEGNWHLLYRTFRANVYKMKKNRANRLVN